MSPATATGFTVLIPARMASSRLPDKPLADIAGLPMVVHVARRAAQSAATRVVVAADDPEHVDDATWERMLAINLTGTMRVCRAAIPLLRWALPVGISFYTFSAVGYLMDVYRGTVAPERSLLTFGTYLTMFPKLVSGPIASYTELQPEFGARNVSLRQAVDGLKLFLFGMALKVLLANQLGGWLVGWLRLAVLVKSGMLAPSLTGTGGSVHCRAGRHHEAAVGATPPSPAG